MTTPPRRRRHLVRPVNIVSVELPVDGRSERRQFELCLQVPFRPFALVVWGARAETKVRDLVMSAESQLLSTIPAFMFEADISFDEYQKLLTLGEGYPTLSMANFDRVGHIFELSMPTVAVASPMALDLEGPLEHAVFLGHVLGERESTAVLSTDGPLGLVVTR